MPRPHPERGLQQPQTSPQSNITTQPAHESPHWKLRSQAGPVMSTQGSSSRGKSVPAPDWLPYARRSPLRAREGHMRLAQAHKHHDWFFALICHMGQAVQDCGTQDKVLCKMYFFMRDYFPNGLEGHIKGDTVMKQLLFHNETTMSRHKVTKQAEVAFADLERWMGSHGDWKAAADAARTSAQAEKKTGKKKGASKAPGLLSPESMADPFATDRKKLISPDMMAVLIIAHPDNKFKDWIGHLGIHWMMDQNPDSLSVEQGFWGGINSQNVLDVFEASEIRLTNVKLLADYSRLFGPDFPACKKDMRPFLPAWADISLLELPSDHDEGPDSSDETAGPVSLCSSEDVAFAKILAKHLCDPVVAGPDELQKWLMDVIATDDGDDILLTWGKHWERRATTATTYREQLVVKSLFLHSLRCLYSFCHTEETRTAIVADQTTIITAYVIADATDGELLKLPVDDHGKAKESLHHLPQFRAFLDVESQLVGAVEAFPAGSTERMTSLLERSTSALTCALLDVFHGPTPFQHWKGVFRFNTARTVAIIQDIDKKTPNRRPPVGWKSVRDDILRDENLKLSTWQVRLLARPGADPQRVLTGLQYHIHYHRSASSRQMWTDLRQEPLRVDTHDQAEMGQKHVAMHTILSLPADMEVTHVVPRSVRGKSSTPSTGPADSGRRAAYPDLTRESSAVTSLSSLQVLSTPPPTGIRPSKPATQPPATELPAANKNMVRLSVEDIPQAPAAHISPSNPFAGIKNPRKRKASPDLAERMTKMPWTDVKAMFSAERDHLDEILEAQGEMLQTDIRTLKRNVQALERKLKDNRDTAAEQAKRTVLDFASQQYTSSKAEIGAHFDSLVSRLDSFRSANASVQEELASVNEELATVKEELASVSVGHANITKKLENMGAEIDARLESKFDEFSAAVNAKLSNISGQLEVLQAAATPERPAPVLGDHEYLAAHCPAPADWSQAGYERQLERAAWTYIHTAGNFDDGVGPDEEAFEVIKDRFSALPVAHVYTAIQHTHMRVFQRPFGWKEDKNDSDANA